MHWVITEYGPAYLFGRSLAERAVALIEIAHPDARKSLLEAAIGRGLVGKNHDAVFPALRIHAARMWLPGAEPPCAVGAYGMPRAVRRPRLLS